MRCLEGAVLLNLLLLLHGTLGSENSCGVGLVTPGGEYYIVNLQTWWSASALHVDNCLPVSMAKHPLTFRHRASCI